MSQHDMNIANDSGAQVRADINSALEALVGLSNGAAEPSTTFPHMLWADTTNDLLKIRNAADSGWVTVASWDGTTWVPHSGGAALTRIAFAADKNGTDQTAIANNTFTKVTFTTENFDVGSYYDAVNSKFLPLVAGKYQLTATLRWNGAADATQLGVAIYKNGTIHRFMDDKASGTGGQAVSVSCVVDANGSTDYFEVYAIQASGSAQDIVGTATNTFFCGERVA